MKLYVENNQTIPAIQVLQDSDPAPSGYTEKTSIEDWYNYGVQVLGEFYGFNYLTWRTKIFNLIVAIVNADYSNWNGLNQDQKNIAIELVLAPYSLRVPAITDNQDKMNWTKLVVISQGLPVGEFNGRAEIVEQMREAVGEELRKETISKDDVDLFYKDTFDLISWFIASNAPDFKQWLINEVGTPYENNGFAQKVYYSITRKDYLLEIYQGNY